ncbi:hypothetical protein O7N17_000956 [Salmonella enterica subsp. enterica serovar Cerro]|nr:hypothetical protein [Salmonella enterica]ECV2315624.1 hypothetical protein [Salmonella enterica subsp. enterica serovar Muenster]EHH5868396.1 hypothetical protein [Salmonella enterica subsp. enterica serovar Kentucky]EKH2967574.1 hypothetical protein [Salmonella enterica subsp. enterica serovar Cerro]EHA6898610.1 hypothetical protein [Salmonella enterica]
MNTALVQLKLRERQLQDELEQVWASMDSLLEAHEVCGPITPILVINTLKLMMLEGYGDWLVTPVERTGDGLVTSAEALKVASKETGLRPHLLRGTLSRAQHRPVLVCKDGKLILRVEG